jgi:DNA-binding NarL/FixJ family response regulator
LRSSDAALGRRLGLTVPRSIRRSSKLSPRELEVQELIAQGLTNEEIARLLFISPSTTKVHVRHILEKLGVRSRVEVARLWESPTNDG